MPAARVSAPTAAAGFDEAALGGHVGERDELTRSSSIALERPDVDAGRSSSGPTRSSRPPAGHLQQRDVVARVLGPRRQDAVARPEAERVERHVPGAGGVLDDARSRRRGSRAGGDAS